MFRQNFAKLVVLLFVVMSGTVTLWAEDILYPTLKLDFGTAKTAAVTEPTFTAFVLADSGSEVDGIRIQLAGNLDARDRGTAGVPLALLYRDFLFEKWGTNVAVTLSGLNPNQDYEISIYSFDSWSTTGGVRIADWTANGAALFQAVMDGALPIATEDSFVFRGWTKSEPNGVIHLVGAPAATTAQNQPFAFLNGLTVYSTIPVARALRPAPANGSTITTDTAAMSWKAAEFATKHDVYIGTSSTDVNNATTATAAIYKGRIDVNNYDATGLVPGNTYYWRIDEVQADGTTTKGYVWSILVASLTAYNPFPRNGSQFADPNATLTWLAGAGATSHHVYFGDNQQSVQAGTGGTDKGTMPTTTFAAGLLERGKTYYWRVDEMAGATPHPGMVWSFTTSPAGLGTVDMDIWENVGADATLNLLTADPRYPDSPTRTDTLTSFSSANGVGDGYGGRIHGWLYVPVTGDYTFYFTSAGEGELWLSTNDEPENVQLLAAERVWGSYNAFSHKSDPVPLIGGNKYYIMAIWKDFASWDHCQAAWIGPGVPGSPTDPPIIAGNYLSPYARTSAGLPRPSSGATDISDIVTLQWRAGDKAVQHNVYFGTDANAVAAATAATTGIFRITQAATRYVPAEEPLVWGQTYYWRVDEVNSLDTQSPWAGRVWSFTVGNYAGVDDFESYDQACDKIWYTWRDGLGFDANSVCGVVKTSGNGTGAIVDPNGRVVRSGLQSMQLSYNNLPAPNYSELQREWASPQDWTRKGLKSLTVWFRGLATNTPAKLYIIVQDSSGNSKTLTNADPNAALATTWQEWNIELKDIAGVTLSSIKKISIGLDNRANVATAGYGVMYFDDIRLYPPRCLLATRTADFAKLDYAPVGYPTSGDCIIDYKELDIMANNWLAVDIVQSTTNPALGGGLRAYYPMDEGTGTSTADASGNGNPGTFSASGVTWVLPGLVGNSAVDVDGGVGSRITIGTLDPVGPSGGFTLALWARWEGQGNASQGLIGKRDGWGSNDVLRFMFEVYANNQLRLGSYVNSAYSQANSMTPYTYSWAHISATFDGATARFYINGQEAGSGPLTLGTNATATMTIGNAQSTIAGGSEAFNGQIDEVRIYDRALSAAEIAYLADLTPADGVLHIPVQSSAELYSGEPEGSQRINFSDFAVLMTYWLQKQWWP